PRCPSGPRRASWRPPAAPAASLAPAHRASRTAGRGRGPSPYADDVSPTPPNAAGSALPRSTPEEQGIPSDAVLRMTRRWDREGNQPHGVVVLRHGHVVAEGAWRPWPRDGIRLAYSVSKTFLAIAAAFAEADVALARDERLVDVFPEAAHAAGPRAATITVEDCLRMSTGHHADTLESAQGLAGGGDESVASFLAA